MQKGMGTEEINLSVPTIFKKTHTKNIQTPDLDAIYHLQSRFYMAKPQLLIVN